MKQLIEELKLKIIETLNLIDVTPADIDPDAQLVGGNLGIDSIDVLEMVMMIERDFGVMIENKELGQKVFASLASLAAHIAAQRTVQAENLMNLLLISANTLTEPYPVYPLGLDYVAGAVRDRHTVRIVDLNTLEGPSALLPIIETFRPDAIGLSIRNIDNTDTSDPKGFTASYQSLAGQIHTATKAPLILGGSGYSIFPQELLRLLEADFGVIGEGERLGALLDALADGRDPSDLPGIISRKAVEGTGEPTGKRPAVCKRHIDPTASHLVFYLRHGGMLNLATQRGCPLRCIYCTYPHIEGRHLRLFPPAEVAATALSLEAAGARFIFITDSAFNADIDHSLAVAHAFKKAGLSIPWGAFLVPFAPRDGYFETLAEAGLRHAEFGTESLDDAVLAAYRKPFGSADVTKAHTAAVAAGLYVAHYLLLGGPGENLMTLQNTFARLTELKRLVAFFFCGMRIYPHTELYHQAIAEGLITDATDLLAPCFYPNPAVERETVMARLAAAKGTRTNWIIGAGGDASAAIIKRLYQRGHCGPLWEHLIR